MKLIYVNYSDLNYREHQDKLLNYVVSNSIFDGVMPYTREWLETTDFYKLNQSILDKDRLGGYALWKPYIILDALEKIDDNDVIVYMDCGDIPVFTIRNHLLEYMSEHDQYFISQNHVGIHKNYTKGDCFHLMGCDEEKYWNAIQLEDGFLAFKKTDFNFTFLREWLKYCCDERIVTDIPNECGLPNFETFVDHRHDQSIITNLQIKHNLPAVFERHKKQNEIYWGVRNHIHWNKLVHKDGEQYGNGSYDWGTSGEIKDG